MAGSDIGWRLFTVVVCNNGVIRTLGAVLVLEWCNTGLKWFIAGVNVDVKKSLNDVAGVKMLYSLCEIRDVVV